MLLELGCSECACSIVGWVDVDVGEEDGGGEGGFDVFPGALVPVTTCTNLEVKGAVHLVLFSAIDGGQMISHERGK